jgi:hypothetical protein
MTSIPNKHQRAAQRRGGASRGSHAAHSIGVHELAADDQSQGRAHVLPVVDDTRTLSTGIARGTVVGSDAVASLVNLAGAVRRSRHFFNSHCSRGPLDGEHMRGPILPTVLRQRPARLILQRGVAGRTHFNTGHHVPAKFAEGPESHNVERLSSRAVSIRNPSERGVVIVQQVVGEVRIV